MTKKIIIIGAGTGGISVACRLLSHFGQSAHITLVDPSDKHFYQPMWTLVGAGVFPFEKSEKKMADVIPEGTHWLKQSVQTFLPEEDKIILEDGTTIFYDLLVVSPGIQLDWHKIKGAQKALEFDNVCSNYLPYGSQKTWSNYQKTTEGNAIFTQPPLPIKCAGAPQKACYLADDYFRKENRRSQINVIFANQGVRIFGVEKYRLALEKVIMKKEIDARFEHNLIEVLPEKNIALFERPDHSIVEIPYSMLHIVPPMSAPDFIKNSPLANEQGWVDVHKHTLQHVNYPNIFSLGDASSLPTSKTGAAIRKEAPVLVANVISYLEGKELTASYNGYTSCPLVTAYGKVIMAEFDYDGRPLETFPFDQSVERTSMWFVKAHLLPVLYWHGMLKGRA